MPELVEPRERCLEIEGGLVDAESVGVDELVVPVG
jgi:hypothetical protein